MFDWLLEGMEEQAKWTKDHPEELARIWATIEKFKTQPLVTGNKHEALRRSIPRSCTGRRKWLNTSACRLTQPHAWSAFRINVIAIWHAF